MAVGLLASGVGSGLAWKRQGYVVKDLEQVEQGEAITIRRHCEPPTALAALAAPILTVELGPAPSSVERAIARRMVFAKGIYLYTTHALNRKKSTDKSGLIIR